MPRTSKAEAPVVVENEVLTSRHVELDEFTVVFESYHVDADVRRSSKACLTTVASARTGASL